MEMLTLSHVSKRFGANTVIDDLSLQVPEHSIYGFIGQNGAGKTTTMKMVLGLYKVDAGEIYVNGERVTYGQNTTNRFIGYLPDVPEFYQYMTPKEYLNLCGEITLIPDDIRKKKINELIELVGLEKANKRIQGFSRGMKQRLGIAQALLNEPKLLICDEPTSALDPIGRKEILDILQTLKEKTTIIFSTHILSDVERICDEIGLLHDGKLALHGTMEQIRKMRQSDGIEVEFKSIEDAKTIVDLFPGWEQIGKTQLLYRNKENATMQAVMQMLIQSGINPEKIEKHEPTLESLFMEVVNS